MTALLIVDLQNDFLPSGALPAKEGEKAVPVINRLMQESKFDLVVASRDWHPKEHGSFALNHPGKKPGDKIELAGLEQILWPEHCIQESEGAEFAAGLETGKIDEVIFKGTDPDIDSYSAFFDNGHKKATGLEALLCERGIQTLYVAGLATDYCVKFTVLDALKLGFEVILIKEGCRGVELHEGDCDRAIEEMRAAGAKIH